MLKSGLWITAGAGKLADAVANSIENNDQFSTTVTQSRIKPRHAEIALVSLEGTSVDYLGISQVGRRVATGQVTIAISNLIGIDDLPCDEIKAKLASRFSKSFDPPSEGAWRPTPRLWEQVLKIVRAERPGASQKLDELNRMVAASRPARGRIAGGLEVFERDAIASALQTFGGSAFRKKVLRRAGPPPRNPAVAPFLSQLREVSVREDPQITHDQSAFPGMEVARRDVVGSVVLTNGVEDLTILNCNRQPLERTLGVDLIYYSHRFESFVLVQYKRMSEGKRGAEYRPGNDPSHEKELQRMMAAEEVLGQLPKMKDAGTSDFRLSGRPFYIKLCEPKAKAALDAGMVSGMYVPLDLWRSLLNSPEAVGPKGGVVISWDNCIRRFSNGEFTNLLRQGWIGSASGESKALSKIVEEVLSSGRMLVLAATTANRLSKDLRRDHIGRFAAEDDPTSAI
jgi:hypothetical protein